MTLFEVLMTLLVMRALYVSINVPLHFHLSALLYRRFRAQSQTAS